MTEASATVLGVVQILYPTIDVNAELAAGGFRLNSIPVPDITDLENAGTGTISALSYAMAAIAGSYVAMVDPNDADYSDLNQVIVTTGAAFTAGVTNGDLGTIGAAAAGVFDTIVEELGAIEDVALPAGLTLDDLGDIADAAAAQAALLNSDPTGVPDIPDICECSDP